MAKKMVVVHKLHLPDPKGGPGVYKTPGEKITAAEWKAAGQTDEDVAKLTDDGAIEEA